MAEDVLRILIVDDEALARRKIRRFLTELAPAAELDEAENGVEALEKIKAAAPDMLFLDIEMPGLGGFDLLLHLGERSFPIVFQTAFDEFAVKAFEANACDYLLKPFSKERFAKAYEKAQGTLLRDSALARLTANLPERQRYLERICVDQRGIKMLLEMSDVDAMVSADHYTCVHSGGKEFLSDISIQRLEERLDPASFVRIHRSAIVRLAAIKAVERGEKDEKDEKDDARDDAGPSVTLKNGMSLPLSRRCRKSLLQRLRTLRDLP